MGGRGGGCELDNVLEIVWGEGGRGCKLDNVFRGFVMLDYLWFYKKGGLRV